MGPIAALLAAALLGGCGAKPCPPETPSRYALVEYRTGAELGKAPKVEVSTTASYDAVRGNLSTAAIRLPDSCLNQAASEVSGVARSGQTILQTQCGVWLAEIERSLARTGFRVVSWDVLRQREQQKKISTYEAAKELGAEVVFVFNSLETGDIKGGAMLGATFKYFLSNERGERGPKLALDDTMRAQIRNYVTQVAGANATQPNEVIALSATLDSTAIVTQTGESVWFYRRTVALPTERTSGMRFLFANDDRPYLAGTWVPARPIIPEVKFDAGPRFASEDASASEVLAQANDAFAAQRLQLVREGAADFVQSFRSGKASTSRTTKEDR